MLKQLHQYKFLLAPLILSIILPSLGVPWITVNLLGQHSFSPIDIAQSAIKRITGSGSHDQFDVVNLFAQYPESYFALIVSMVIYVTSLAMMMVSITGKKRTRALLIAGILAIAAGALWIYAIESFKINFIQEAVSAGGIIGEEWKGQEHTIVNSIVMTGFGHYIVILAGAIAIFASVWR